MRTLLLILASTACSKSRPTLTAERMPPPLAGLALSRTTEAELLAKHPDLTVEPSNYNDRACDEVHMPGLRFYVSPPGKDGKLIYARAKAPGMCEWVTKTIAPLSGSQTCPGNRKTGNSGGQLFYCMELDDKPIAIECVDDAVEVRFMQL